MEAEQGEFVNLELAFAYRAGRIKNKMKDKTKNAHLYLAFYLPGNIKLRKSLFFLTPLWSLHTRILLERSGPTTAHITKLTPVQLCGLS